MRNTSLWIAASLVALSCGCKSKESKDAKDSKETKPAGPAVQLGTFLCKELTTQGAAGHDPACVDTTDHFDTTPAAVHVTYTTLDRPAPDDVYVVQWIATDVGQAAPANTVVGTINVAAKDLATAATSYSVNSSLTKPTNGWPVGKYRVEIKLHDKLLTTAPFSIQ